MQEKGRIIGFLHNNREGKIRIRKQIESNRDALLGDSIYKRSNYVTKSFNQYGDNTSNEEYLYAKALINMKLNSSSARGNKTAAQIMGRYSIEQFYKELKYINRQ